MSGSVKTLINRVFLYAPPVLWAGTIFYASSRPKDSLPDAPDIPHLDKAVHAVAYALLGALVLRALANRRAGTPRLALIAVAIAALYGLSDETHQIFVAGRSFDLWDLAADAVGASLGAWAWRRAHRANSKNLDSERP